MLGWPNIRGLTVLHDYTKLNIDGLYYMYDTYIQHMNYHFINNNED